jgi:hypothetical protein
MHSESTHAHPTTSRSKSSPRTNVQSLMPAHHQARLCALQSHNHVIMHSRSATLSGYLQLPSCTLVIALWLLQYTCLACISTPSNAAVLVTEVPGLAGSGREFLIMPATVQLQCSNWLPASCIEVCNLMVRANLPTILHPASNPHLKPCWVTAGCINHANKVTAAHLITNQCILHLPSV